MQSLLDGLVSGAPSISFRAVLEPLARFLDSSLVPVLKKLEAAKTRLLKKRREYATNQQNRGWMTQEHADALTAVAAEDTSSTITAELTLHSKQQAELREVPILPSFPKLPDLKRLQYSVSHLTAGKC